MRVSPLVLRPVLLSKVWGGDNLARFGKGVRSGDTIGESWELADLASTSASGAGGAGVRSVIAHGAFEGKTLSDAMGLMGAALLGSTKLTPSGGFPLLVKFLDAREDLSVQVHPSPAYAATHRDAHLKTECWFVLDAKRGAKIYKGVKPGVTRARFEAALRHGDGSEVVDLLYSCDAVPGECHNLPSGTVHALGAGLVVAEVQTPSDTTFRVYDWGRKGRELHTEQALACIDFGPAPRATSSRALGRFERLVSTEFFKVDAATLLPGGSVGAEPKTTAGCGCGVLVVTAGEGTLRSRSHAFDSVPLPLGTTALVPASIAQDCEVATRAGMTLLRTEVG